MMMMMMMMMTRTYKLTHRHFPSSLSPVKSSSELLAEKNTNQYNAHIILTVFFLFFVVTFCVSAFLSNRSDSEIRASKPTTNVTAVELEEMEDDV